MPFSTEKYRIRREQGLCGRCGKVPPVEGAAECLRCKNYAHKISQQFWARNKDRLRIKKTEENKLLQREVFTSYGSVCACCGEDYLPFLTMDHIHGGGTKARKNMKGNKSIYTWLKKNNFPSGFQILCMNCNWAKRDGKECPCPYKQITYGN
jgi:hypothetical protein